MSRWPHMKHDMIFGDVNAHSPLWDCFTERTDKRGRVIENWLAPHDMTAANQGGATHTHRSTGSETVPDVTIVHASALDQVTWRTDDSIGSDHKPIIVTYEGWIPRVNKTPKFKWKLDKANWTKFAEEVDKKLPKQYKKKNINKLEKLFRKTILKAANKHVGRKKCSFTNKCWLTEEIKEAIKSRNQLRKGMPNTRSEWLKACRETAELIRIEKERLWKTYVEEIDKNSDGRKIWRTIRAMDGRMPPQKKNEVLEVNGISYVQDRAKAEQFAKTYKEFSKLPKRKGDREVKRKIWDRLKTRTQSAPLQESEQDISLEEMNRAIAAAGNRKASGDDDIPYEFIKNLGPVAREFLLHIYRKCWRGDGIPSKWTSAVIKTLLKDGKDPKQTTSYRPISLTACLGKILERIVADRLVYILESRKMLSQNQAGFRQGRCTTDQVLKLVQDATDNVHAPKAEGHRTMVCFFDYAKAYDKIWRDGLISKMLEMEIPPRFIKYTRHFLSGRNTWVEVNNKRSDKFVLKEGLPQGSCISPLLFLIFINDIDVKLDLATAASLFADDTSAWRRDGKVRGSERTLMQQEIDKITKWAEENKMSINVDKTQCMVVGTAAADQSWNPQLTANGEKIKPTKEYKFLGVTINNNLWFKKHIDNITKKGNKRNKILKCMSTKSWGWSLETQKQLYIQYNRSGLEYASSSWSSWVSKTATNRLQRVQNEALRTAAGLAKTCPMDFLHAETGVEPIKDRLEKNDMITYEKYLRLDDDDPRKVMTERPVTKRLTTRLGWRSKTEPLMKEFEHIKRAGKPVLTPPWRKTKVEFQRVELEKRKSEYTEVELREMSTAKINELQVKYKIYTDGSTNGKQEKGGAGVYVTDSEDKEIHKAFFAAGAVCSSFQAECVAMEKAVDWLLENSGDSAVITDSMSMVEALKAEEWKNSDYHLAQIKHKLHMIESKVILLWVPSHCDVAGNEVADKLADRGAKESQQGIAVSEKIMKARIRRGKWQFIHERTARMYKDRRRPKMEIERSWPRKVRSAFSRLRTGHSKLLAQYRYLIDKADSPVCECGNEDEEQTIDHLLCSCPLLNSSREQLKIHNISPDWMVTDPDLCRKLLSARFPELKLGTGTEEDTSNPEM